MLLGFRIDFISDMDGVMLEPLNYEVGFKLQVPSGDLSEVVLRGADSRSALVWGPSLICPHYNNISGGKGIMPP